MPSSYDSSTSSVEIIGATSPRSARAIATDAATADSTANVAAPALSGPVAEDYISSFRGQRAVNELCRKHSVPEAYTARPAGDRPACTPPPEGAVCVYADALEAGMRVPLHRFFCEVLNHFGLAPSQLMPNGWRILVGFVVLCHDAGVPPSLAVFGHFFKLRSKLGGWYYIQRKKYKARPLFTGLPNCIKGWQDKFLFLTSPEPWPCPVRWGEPPSKSFLNDPVLTSEEKKLVAKLRDAHGTPVDLRTYLSEDNLAATFCSNLVGTHELPPPSASVRSNGLGTDQPAKKAAPSTSRTENVKPEPSPNDYTPALSGKKRNREEANSKDEHCNSDLNSLPGNHGSSVTSLPAPPGFDPNARRMPQPDTRDVDSTSREAARKEMEQRLGAAKPSDLASSAYESMLQTVNYASSYALELEKKLAEETALRAKEAAARAELEKKLVAQDEEVVALRGQLKKGKPWFENTEFAALQQVLKSEDQVRRRAEHALERYQGWKSRHAPRRP
ncbi:unnamed protein product [Alopecurus aequalis]